MKVAVIGAGVAGLSVAARLAQKNIAVDIYDKNPIVGGKMYQYTNADGLSWDTGPTLISLPDEIDLTFSELNFPAPELIPLKENSHLYFSDGTSWTIPMGKQNVIDFFYQQDKNTGKSIEKVLKISEAFFNFGDSQLFEQNPPNFFQIAIKALQSKFLLTHPHLTLNSYVNVVDNLIKDQNLREFFYHFASYIGILPSLGQAGLLSIAHVELNSKIVFPIGGVYSIAEALKKACEKYRVNFFLEHDVQEAKLTQNTQEWSIVSAHQNQIQTKQYDIIISNCDPYVATKTWLKEPAFKQKFSRNLSKNRYSPSESQVVILYEWDDSHSAKLAHHTKIFPKSWKKSFEMVWNEKKLPDDPCVYLVWPHATDSSVSPKILFISAMAPNTLAEYEWTEHFTTMYAQKVLEICRDRLGLALKGKSFKVITPYELQTRTNALYGGIYTANPKFFTPTHFTFSGRTNLNNLYFVGAGVHPGAGVTMVMKSARRIARMILNQI